VFSTWFLTDTGRRRCRAHIHTIPATVTGESYGAELTSTYGASFAGRNGRAAEPTLSTGRLWKYMSADEKRAKTQAAERKASAAATVFGGSATVAAEAAPYSAKVKRTRAADNPNKHSAYSLDAKTTVQADFRSWKGAPPAPIQRPPAELRYGNTKFEGTATTTTTTATADTDDADDDADGCCTPLLPPSSSSCAETSENRRSLVEFGAARVAAVRSHDTSLVDKYHRYAKGLTADSRAFDTDYRAHFQSHGRHKRPLMRPPQFQRHKNVPFTANSTNRETMRPFDPRSTPPALSSKYFHACNTNTNRYAARCGPPCILWGTLRGGAF
jgi:hypothetical protein